MKQIPLSLGIASTPSFETFRTGANEAVIAHLKSLKPTSAPVYLWGPSGSGKTHLLRAVTHHFQEDGAHVGWFEAGDPLPWQPGERWPLIVLDRCDDFSPAEQQAAFVLFIEAAGRGVPVAAAGRVPPVDLPLRDDLRTRLAWGHVFMVQPLDDSDVRGALRREADRRGVFLSDEVMEYLLSRFTRDLKNLMALLDRLDRFSIANKRLVTVPLLKQMLAEGSA
ncbi:MAG: regulatory inactivation of DnaA Hda protein [Rhizobacter sp.]|nr:regulatory inactivation of DnaA Hda protein [Rhizobacter sp.]